MLWNVHETNYSSYKQLFHHQPLFIFFPLRQKNTTTTAARHATEKLQNSFLCPEALTLEALFLPKSAN